MLPKSGYHQRVLIKVYRLVLVTLSFSLIGGVARLLQGPMSVIKHLSQPVFNVQFLRAYKSTKINLSGALSTADAYYYMSCIIELCSHPKVCGGYRMLIYRTTLNIISASSFEKKKTGFHYIFFFSSLRDESHLSLFMRLYSHKAGLYIKEKKVHLKKCETPNHDLISISRIFTTCKGLRNHLRNTRCFRDKHFLLPVQNPLSFLLAITQFSFAKSLLL